MKPLTGANQVPPLSEFTVTETRAKTLITGVAFPPPTHQMTLREMLEDICQSAGLNPDECDFSELQAEITGYILPG